MRELIERFRYRYQLWSKEQRGEFSGADPSSLTNPLRFVAFAAIVSIILDIVAPFVSHNALDILTAIRVPAALLFLIFYQTKSKWACHVVVVGLLAMHLAYWILRVGGYAPYQPARHAPLIVVIAFDVALSGAILFWLFRIRERYWQYIRESRRH